MAAPDIELIQFAYSHYNEKVRWALDYKKVPHRRTTLLPGPHARTVKKLTGSTLVPVIRIGDRYVNDSAQIIAELEQSHPLPSLYPADSGLKEQALEVQRYFDDEVGPEVRRALFSVLLTEPSYLARIFACHRSAIARTLYRSTFPLVAPMMTKSMGLDDPNTVESAYEKTQQAFEFVAERGGTDGPLVGDCFSVADLCAAALLAPAVDPPDCAMTRPEPKPDSMKRWHEHWTGHPGAGWVRAQYRHHRPRSSPGGCEPAPG